MRFKIKSLSAWVLAAGMGSIWLFPSYSLSQAPYYQGKTITIIRGGKPGGSGDMQARALISYLKKYIPGEPTIIIENMPGAAGRKAANFIYSAAKPDGLRIGAQTVGHPNYVSGRLFAYLMGLKNPRFVVGYSGPEVDVALARGEVDARANTSDTVVRRSREALEKGQFHIHATITIPKGKFHPRFANVPELDTFAKNERERQLVNLFRTFLYPRWPYILPPGTPPEIVNTLRGAMVKTFKDPVFPNEFKKLMASDPSPLTGEEGEPAIRELPRDPEIVGLYKKMAE